MSYDEYSYEPFAELVAAAHRVGGDIGNVATGLMAMARGAAADVDSIRREHPDARRTKAAA